jgi:glutathione S-transferase
MTKPTLYHIPVCPFCQRIEIVLGLKGQRPAVDSQVIDITTPRPDWLLQLTRGSTSLPVLVTPNGVLKESLVIMRYLEELLPGPAVLRATPYERAIENMLVAFEGDFTGAGYRFVMNRDPAKRDAHRDAMLTQYKKLDEFLTQHSPDGVFLFDRFGWAEATFTPMFMRFWFLDYYEGFDLPAVGFERVKRWREACLAHPVAQQVSREEIVKVYYDYAVGSGNGALPAGRNVSSFTFDPPWQARPWPPRDKYDRIAADVELGLA